MELEERERYEAEQQLREWVLAQMTNGEQLLWQDVPHGAPQFGGGRSQRVGGVIWLAFALFWEATVLSTLVPVLRYGGAALVPALIMPAFGLPFIWIGLDMVFLWPAKQRKRLKSAVYAVTNRRVIIFYRSEHTVFSQPLASLGGHTSVLRADGYTDLVFQGIKVQGKRRREPFLFYAVEGAQVEQVLQMAGAK